MKAKRGKSDIAEQLMDSLLDDVENIEGSYSEAPSETVSIGGLVPLANTKEEKKLKEAVEKARSWLPSEDGTQAASSNSGPDASPDQTAAILWSELEGGSPDENTFALELKGNKSSSEKEDALEAKTVVAASAKRSKEAPEPKTKVRFGGARSSSPKPTSEARSFSNPDASLVQAESLKLAQERILQLESEVEKLRAENEELASAGETLKDRADELLSKVEALERSKKSQKEDLDQEIVVLRDRASFKEGEIQKLKSKNSELENRLQRDFKKVRVRERELENRLELAKLENAALIRSKDETILDLKRRVDQLESEAEAYRQKCQELNHQIDSNQEQFRRTVKALRLALTNLEVDDESLAHLKKAE